MEAPGADRTDRHLRKLVETLKAELTELKVFKAGETEVTVYVVGKTTAAGPPGVFWIITATQVGPAGQPQGDSE